MIDKSYINFYSKWYYKKIGDEYKALEVGKNNAIVTEIKECKKEEFIKKISKVSCWVKPYEFNAKEILLLAEKYDWLKAYYREILITRLKRPIIFSLLVTAVKNKDFELSDYIISVYNLTDSDAKSWKIETLYKFDLVSFSSLKYGETFFRLKNNNEYFGREISYQKGETFTIINNVRYNLSEELIKQLDDATDTFYTNLNEVFLETNGYNLVDFGNGRFLGYKRLENLDYHFIVVKKLNDEFIYLVQDTCSIAFFLRVFDFERWGIGEVAINKKEKYLPLLNSAKKVGDKFLECEVKYILDMATKEEIDYLNEVDNSAKNERVLLNKDVYDLDEIKILGVSNPVFRKYYLGTVVDCEFIIENKELVGRYLPKSSNPNVIMINTAYKRIKISVTDNVIKRLNEMIDSITVKVDNATKEKILKFMKKTNKTDTVTLQKEFCISYHDAILLRDEFAKREFLEEITQIKY